MIDVADAELQDLRCRLARTRWPVKWPARGWDAGVDRDELARLVDYWQNGYDWRRHEAQINALPSHLADIDGIPLHFLRYDATEVDATPIVVTHGWPSSFLEMTELARRLADQGFTVIVPSLPGFAFSPQRSDAPTHELWHRLMRDHLGFERYAAHGGDLGAGVSSRLAEAHPDAVIGVHLLAVADRAELDRASITDEEQAYLDESARWFTEAGGYEHEQMTRPVTLSYGLADSPAGLLAWIVEKYREWSDCDGVLSRTFSDDFVLTQASLYWFTNTISTSFRPYYDHATGQNPPLRRVSVPTAVAVFPKDLVHPPRSWAERIYNVTRYTVMPRGGHFAAHEQPQLLANDITAFVRACA